MAILRIIWSRNGLSHPIETRAHRIYRWFVILFGGHPDIYALADGTGLCSARQCAGYPSEASNSLRPRVGAALKSL